MALKADNPQSDRARGVTIPFKLLKIVAVAVIVVAAGVAVWYFATSRPTSSPTTRASSSAAVKTIHLTYPSDWTVASAKSVRGAPSNAVIVLQRKDKSGVLVVLPGGQAPALDVASSKKISATLAKQYADYKFLSAAVVRLKAGKALFITYLRTKQGDLHTITILPVGRKSFIVETASPAANGTLGTEIGKILKSATVSSNT